MGIARAHEATERFLEGSNPNLILSVGYAGAADPTLRAGDLVLPTEIRSETPSDRFVTDPHWRGEIERLFKEQKIPYKGGPLKTAWNLVGKRQKEEWGREGVVAVDMETAAIAAVVEKRGIPFVSLRVIFDTADEEILGMTTLSPLFLFKIPKFFWMHRLCQKRLGGILSPLIKRLEQKDAPRVLEYLISASLKKLHQ